MFVQSIYGIRRKLQGIYVIRNKSQEYHVTVAVHLLIFGLILVQFGI